MKRTLALLLVILLSISLFACDKYPDPGVTTVSDSGEKFMIGLICPDDSDQAENDSCLHANHLVKAMRRNGMDTDGKMYIENSIPTEKSAVREAIDRLVESGADMIFGIDAGYADAMVEAAKVYPNVIFCQYGRGDGNGANYIRYYVPVHRGYTILGAAAGQRSTELNCDSIGFISLYGLEDSEATAAINAFAVAARIFNPEATVYLKVTKSGSEGEAARALIQEQGCKVLAQYGGGETVLTTASELGAVACGSWFYSSGQNVSGHLISPEYSWYKFYVDAIEKACKCDSAANFAKKMRTDSFTGTVGIDDDSVLTVTAPGPGAGAYTKCILPYMQGTNSVFLYNEETEDPDDGKTVRLGINMDVFCGWRFWLTQFDEVYTATKFEPADLKDRDGDVIVAAGGTCMTLDEILAMDYYLEGVEPVE